MFGHFFNVFVDHEINLDELCKVLTSEQIRDLELIGDFSFNCSKESIFIPKQRISDVKREDLDDKCD